MNENMLINVIFVLHNEWKHVNKCHICTSYIMDENMLINVIFVIHNEWKHVNKCHICTT